MKRLGVCFGLVFLLVLMVSCFTTDYYGGSNVYSTKSYSSQYVKTPIYQNEGIVVYVNTDDYSFNRQIELELKKRLENSNCLVEIMTDYNYTSNTFLSVLDSINYKYLMEITISNGGEYYKYEYGGGIRDMGFDVDVYIRRTGQKIIKISTNVYGQENNGESYISSVENISSKVSRSIVSELSKYF